MFLLGCALGSVFVSSWAEVFGRKRTILVAASVFLIGGVFQSFATGVAMFFMGRLVSGTGIGVLSMVVPLFISETSPTAIRGRMITIQQLMITIGILIASIVNEFIGMYFKRQRDDRNEWRIALGMQMIPAAALIILNFVMPESPRWLASKGKSAECAAIIARLEGAPITAELVQEEISHIMQSIEKERSVGNGSWSEIFEPGICGRTFRSSMLQFFQQWTGINCILYYKTNLLRGMGFDPETTAAAFSIITNVVNVVGTFPGMWAIEKYGRTMLLFVGGIAMGLSHFGIFVSLYFSAKVSSLNFLAVSFAWLFILAFAATWGPVPWVYQSGIL